MSEFITINIGNICDGAMIEAFELKLQEVLKDIMDPNTEARAKREIRLVLKLHPKDDRIKVNAEFTCEAKLATFRPATSEIFIGKYEDGALCALAADPRQMNLFTPPKPRVIQFSSAK